MVGRIASPEEAFRQGLHDLGYIEGQNIVVEWRSAKGNADRLPDLATELVRLKVDVIVVGLMIHSLFVALLLAKLIKQRDGGSDGMGNRRVT